MRFNDEKELAAWSSAWDATASGVSNIQPGAGERVCTRFADAKIEAMRERQEPQRSERGALERIRAWIGAGMAASNATTTTERIQGFHDGLASALMVVQDELARQPADELSSKVKAVVEAARAVVEGWGRGALCKEYGALRAAVKALDGGGA